LMDQETGWEGGDLKGSMFAGVAFDADDPDVCVTCNPAYSQDRIGHVVGEGLNTGRLTPAFDKSLYTGREPLTGALCVTCHLPPQASKRITFVLTLDFPEIRLPGHVSRKRYVKYFPQTSMRAVEMTKAALQLRAPSLRAAQELHASLGRSPGLDWLFPPTAHEARDQYLTLLGNLLAFYPDATIWNEQGEALLRESADYPFFNVLDVYFYGVFSLSRLLPQTNAAILRRFAQAILAEDRSLRRYWHYTREPFADLPDPRHEGPRAVAGAVPHDLGNPFDCRPDAYIWHNVKQWKDLAPKYVLLVLYEFRISQDKQFLEDCWLAVRAAMEYLSSQRLPGESIPLTQGNEDTFDNLPSYGVSAYSGSLWIAGLSAAAEIARVLGRTDQEWGWRDLARAAREEFVATLWDEEHGYYHYFATPITVQDCRNGTERAEGTLRSLNQYLNSSSLPRLAAEDWQTVEDWVSTHHPQHRWLLDAARQGVIDSTPGVEGDGLEGHGQKLCRKDLRTFKKLLLAALQPQRWTDAFHGKLFLDSDDILCAQLLADTWLELLDLPPITPKDRRRRVLERIMAMNFRTHSPTVGAANLVSRTGATLAASQAQDVWIGIQFGLVAALVSADMPEEAREILGICYYNLYEKTRIPFAVPEGFNGNSPLTVADLAYALKVDSATAQSLLTALTGCGFIQSNGRVVADIHQVTAEKFAHALQQASQPLECSPERSSELLHLLHTWGLRYTAGRYHRPGMAFCILDMLARKAEGSSAGPCQEMFFNGKSHRCDTNGGAAADGYSIESAHS